MNGLGHPLDEGSPARRIIELLLRQGRMTIAQLVESTGVTTTAIRQQVDRLVFEGWLVREGRRGGLGRPAHVMSVSNQTKRLFGQQSDDLARMAEATGRGRISGLFWEAWPPSCWLAAVRHIRLFIPRYICIARKPSR